MDVLRKELNEIYAEQHLDNEILDNAEIGNYARTLRNMSLIDNSCSVITDIACDKSYLFAGSFSRLLGLSEKETVSCEISSSDEDCIYNRIHPEDLVDKRMLEYAFFKFTANQPPEQKRQYKATCKIRIKNSEGNYIYVDNTTQLLQLSPAGMIWLILCRYALSPMQDGQQGISSRIVNNETGEIRELSFSENRNNILSSREKEILRLIQKGKLSKEIAYLLNISLYTVNRHRQNILQKLSVNNSLEAVKAATEMKLI